MASSASDPAPPPYASLREYLDDLTKLAQLLVERWDWEHFFLERKPVAPDVEVSEVGSASPLEVLRETARGSWRPHPMRETLDSRLRDHEALMARREAGATTPLPLRALSDTLRLQPLERRALAMITLSALEPRLDELVRAMEERDGQRGLTVGKVIAACSGDPKERLALHDHLGPEAPLLYWGVVQRERAAGAPDTRLHDNLTVAPWLVEYLGDPTRSRLATGEQLPAPAEGLDDRDEIGALLQDKLPSLVWLCGSTSGWRRNLATRRARAAGLRAFVLRISPLPVPGDLPREAVERERGEALRRLRQDVLQVMLQPDAMLVIEGVDHWAHDATCWEGLFNALRGAQTLAPLNVIVSAKSREILPPASRWLQGYARIEVDDPSPFQSEERWIGLVAESGFAVDERALCAFAGRYSLSDQEMEQVMLTASQFARSEALLRPAQDRIELTVRHLHRAARQLVAHRLGSLAEIVESDFSWKDLVLPTTTIEQLWEFTQLYQHGEEIRHNWGYGRGLLRTKGLSALFTGPPGTGKTLSAMVMANHLGLELYRVDLSRVTSKWVGETEKNLSLVFDEAERCHCLLLFDEADSLFSKRTEVKSSVDRYSNMEVSYLLQRIESYEGMVVLTTNLATSIDAAFQRRLNAVIQYVIPDADTRTRLWLALIPAQTPVLDDVDFGWLGENVELAGGHIKNVLVRAAVWAMERGQPLSMEAIVRACDSVLRTIGRLPMQRLPPGLDLTAAER